MTELLITECQIKPGRWAEAVQFLADHLPATRAFEGCQGLSGYREHDGERQSVTDFVGEGGDAGTAGAEDVRDDGERLVFIEYWDSLEDYYKYVAWRTTTGDMLRFVELCEGPPTLRTFDLVNG